MIGKKIPNPNRSASKTVRVGSLADYIVAPEQEREGKPEKCLYEGNRGFLLSEDHEGRKAEMLALAVAAVRSPDPIDHWVLSWQEGEQPTPKQIEEVLDILVKELGVEGHQMIYGLHADTENYHLHIALNRVNPDTEKVVKINRGFDHEAVLLAVERIEDAQGWKREPGAIHRERDERGHIVRIGERVLQPNAKAREFEARTGTKSAERIAQEDVGPIIRDSQTWGELHKKLAAIGVEYQQKGSGAVLRIGELNVKASRAGRDCGMGNLAKRLGEFQPAQGIHVQPRAPEPIKSEHQELWKAYTQERNQWRVQKQRDRLVLQKRHEAERKEARAAYKQRRESFLGSRSNWKGYGQMLNAQRSVLAAQQAAIMAELRDRQRLERVTFQAERPSFPDFERWMRRKKEIERAEEFRYRHDQARIVGPEYQAPRPRDIRDFTAEIANGAVIYRAKGRSAASFVDRGKQIDISQSNDRAAVLAALQLSAQKWGTFYVYGDDRYKQLCVELAVRHGFKIANPELQNAIHEARGPKREQPAIAPLERGADAGAVYLKHYEDVKVRQNGNGKLDPSRVDAMIAVRMRATGHERKEIEQTIARCAPAIRKGENRDWARYVERTAAFAFGLGGERQLASLERYVTQWRKLEGMDRSLHKLREPDNRRLDGAVPPVAPRSRDTVLTAQGSFRLLHHMADTLYEHGKVQVTETAAKLFVSAIFGGSHRPNSMYGTEGSDVAFLADLSQGARMQGREITTPIHDLAMLAVRPTEQGCAYSITALSGKRAALADKIALGAEKQLKWDIAVQNRKENATEQGRSKETQGNVQTRKSSYISR